MPLSSNISNCSAHALVSTIGRTATIDTGFVHHPGSVYLETRHYVNRYRLDLNQHIPSSHGPAPNYGHCTTLLIVRLQETCVATSFILTNVKDTCERIKTSLAIDNGKNCLGYLHYQDSNPNFQAPKACVLPLHYSAKKKQCRFYF